MNPYEAPSTTSEVNPEVHPAVTMAATGRPCSACGSLNTSRDSALRPRPSILFVIFFGWVFLLFRGAFAMRRSQCRDCGEVMRYKSASSWIALVIVILLLIQFALRFIDENILYTHW